MTQEEKAKAYDEVVARINKAVSDGLVSENFGRDMLGIAESEGERIRKVIHKILVAVRKEIFTAQDKDVTKDKALAYLEKQKEQKPIEWGEADEEMRDKITNYLCSFIYPNSLYRKDAKECINWLKSRSPYLHWKPSKREMDAFETALKGEFQNGVYPAATLCGLFGELKKLYYNDEIPPHWKPSDEQMEALKEYVEEARGTHNASMGGYPPYLNLKSLYGDLKKL